MRKNRKLIILLMASLMVVSMSAFIKTDFGVVVENDNGEVMVFKEIALDKNNMEGLSLSDATRIASDAMSNDNWDSKDIDRHEDGVHLIGTRFEKEAKSKELIEAYIEIAALFDSDYSYKKKSSIGSQTVTVKIKPSNQQIYQAAQEVLGYGKGPDDKYTFSIVTPGKISYTNGTVGSDGKTASWDIKDIVLNGETAELTVKYDDYSAYPFIFGGTALIIGIIVFIILRRKKTVKFEEGSIYSAPVNRPENNLLTDEVNDMVPRSRIDGKCPNCGGPLTEDGMFCENCGTFV